MPVAGKPKSTMQEDIKEILIGEAQLSAKVRELGARISEDYRDESSKLLLISVLKGSVIFMADLMRAIPIPLETDFMAVSSYRSGTKSTGAVKINKDLDIDIEGFDLLIVEDILDSGVTLSYLKRILSERKPASIRVAALLDKPDRRTADISADYVGFRIPDEFVVGYGLDYNEKYRNLPYIGALKRSVYDKGWAGKEMEAVLR